MTDECLFCIKYLADHLPPDEDISSINPNEIELGYEFHIFKCNKNYWNDIATALRELWPTGEKDDKYPWRDSVQNIAKRLRLMWSIRFPDKNYTKEQILQVARMYLSKFQYDRKYMKILKYFILKQEKIIDQTGKISYNNSSSLADMLESAEADGLLLNENLDIEYGLFGNDAFVEEGEIV